jgi:hypothetical protein
MRIAAILANFLLLCTTVYLYNKYPGMEDSLNLEYWLVFAVMILAPVLSLIALFTAARNSRVITTVPSAEK